jgi:hypothetical protein
MEKSDLLKVLSEASDAYQAAAKQYETETDAWWEALPYDDKLRAFYSVVKRIYEGDVKQQGSYRYVLYEVFGFGPDAYGIGMDCGYMSLHNSIMSEADQKIIEQHYQTKGQL